MNGIGKKVILSAVLMMPLMQAMDQQPAGSQGWLQRAVSSLGNASNSFGRMLWNNKYAVGSVIGLAIGVAMVAKLFPDEFNRRKNNVAEMGAGLKRRFNAVVREDGSFRILLNLLVSQKFW